MQPAVKPHDAYCPAFRSALRCIPIVLLLAASVARADGSHYHPCSNVFPPDIRPYGVSYEEWAERYLQYTLAFPATQNPAADNAPPEAGQPRGVWFLPTVTGNRTVTRSITVPAFTPLFFGALSIRTNNTECPTDTSLTVDELTARTQELWATALEASVSIDGEPVPGLEDPQTTPYLVQTGPFPITLADHDNQVADGGLTCVPDGATLEPNVARGVFLMVRPLAVGQHTIRIRGVAGPPDAPAFTKDVTYEIEVVRR
jgi:hypothetical protein